MNISYAIRRNVMVSLVFARVGDITGKHVLDAGCGEGSWGHHMRSVKGWNHAYKVGIDLFRPFVKLAKSQQLYNDVVVGDVRFLLFKDAAFDFVLSIFVLEHLIKADGDLFLSEAKRICLDVFILLTEHGYKPAIESGIPIKVLKENPLLNHRSGWICREFQERAFTVRGVGVKCARKLPWPCRIFVYILFPFTYMLPQFADRIIAYKMLSKV